MKMRIKNLSHAYTDSPGRQRFFRPLRFWGFPIVSCLRGDKRRFSPSLLSDLLIVRFWRPTSIGPLSVVVSFQRWWQSRLCCCLVTQSLLEWFVVPLSSASGGKRSQDERWRISPEEKREERRDAQLTQVQQMGRREQWRRSEW